MLHPETYHLFTCDGCHQKQLVSFGDMNDFCAIDVEAVRCFACGKVERVDESEGEASDADEDELYIEDGKALEA